MILIIKDLKKKVYDIVKSKKFINSTDPGQDMNELYLIADYVFCDYGGSIFGALYLNKKILLMNHEKVHLAKRIYNSSALEIRQKLPSINKNDCDQNFLINIENILLNSENKIKNEKIREIYFGDTKKDGFCSDYVVKRLDELYELSC